MTKRAETSHTTDQRTQQEHSTMPATALRASEEAMRSLQPRKAEPLYVDRERPRGITNVAVLCAVFLVSFFLASSAWTVWPVSGGGPALDSANDSVTDGLGFTYTVGSYNGRAFFGSFELNAEGLSDIYVMKTSPSGDVVWAATAGGPSLDEGRAIALDPGGNIYVTGFFSKTAIFKNAAVLGGPAAGGVALPHSAAMLDEDDFGEIFVAKLDPNGEWKWAAQTGDQGTELGHDEGNALAFLPGDAGASPPTSDGIIVAGQNRCNTRIDGDGDVTGSSCDELSDAFVGKLDTFGNWEWVELQGNNNTEEFMTELVSAADGTLYGVGTFNSTTTIDGTTISPTSTSTTAIELSFWHRYRTESGFDGGVLEYSTNGSTWHDILAGPTPGIFVQGGYNRTLSTGFNNPLPSRQAWSGDNGAFTEVIIDIAAMVDTTPRFRFRFGYDESVSPSGTTLTKGWWVDDFEISNASGTILLDDFEDEVCQSLFSLAHWLSYSDCQRWTSRPGPLNGVAFLAFYGVPAPIFWFTNENSSAPNAHSGTRAMFVRDIAPNTGSDLNELGLTSYLIARGDSTLVQRSGTTIFGSVPSTFFTKIIDAPQGSPTWDWVETTPSGVDPFAVAVRSEGGSAKLFFAGGASKGATWGGTALSAGDGMVAKYDVGSKSFDWVEKATNSVLTGVALSPAVDQSLYVSGRFSGTTAFSGGSVSSSGGDDALVAKLTSGGLVQWMEKAGGVDDDGATDVTTSPTGEEVFLTGDFMGTAAFGVRELVTFDGDTNVFVANLSALGDWFFQEFQTWFVGAEVPRPAGAFDDPGDIASNTPQILLSNAPGQFTDYFFYSPSDGKLISIQPVEAEIRWRTLSIQADPQNNNHISKLGQASLPPEYCGTVAGDAAPSCKQLHMAGAPAEIQPPSAPLTFTTLGVLGSLGNNFSGAASPDSRIGGDPTNPEFLADTPGFSVLIYVDAPANPDILNNPLLVRVVETVRLDTAQMVGGEPVFVDGEACTVGSKLDMPELRHTEPGRTGYVLSQLSMFDGVGPDAAHDRGSRTGTIIPVNAVNPLRTTDLDQNGISDQQMALAWYTPDDRNVFWPDGTSRFDCQWPINPDRIIIASQLGSEGLGQELLDPLNFPSLRQYVQNDPLQPGYNPNDEHAFFAPSNLGSGLDALFAVRADFAQSAVNQEASLPYSLVKYFDTDLQEWAFKVYRVEATGAGFNNFRFTGLAASKINPPYPVVLLGGCPQTLGFGDPFFLDYQNSTWAKAAGEVSVFYYYPLQAGFHYDRDFDNEQDFSTFDCVPWMDLLGTTPPGQPIEVEYSIDWPTNVPLLQVGETLLEPKRGLPDIFNQAAAEVVFDEIDPTLQDPFTSLGKLIDPINPRTIRLTNSAGEAIPLPSDIAIENDGGNQVPIGSANGLIKLPFTVRARILFDPINRDLSWRGAFDDSGVGEPLLLVNVMSVKERDLLKSISTDSDYVGAVDALYLLSRNPQRIDLADGTGDRDGEPDDAVLVGFQDRCIGNFCRKIPLTDQNTGEILEVAGNPTDLDQTGHPVGDGIAEPLEVLGVNGAFTAGDSPGTGFVTLAFNNDPTLAPLSVSLNIIRVDCLTFPLPPEVPILLSPYQGEVLVVESDNIFDEQLTLRHSGDFGGSPDQFDFEWFFQFDSDGTAPKPLPSPEIGQLNGWLGFPVPAQGANEITISGPTLQTLSDAWYVVRYKRRRPPGDDPADLGVCENKEFFSVFAGKGGTPLDPDAQLAEGWIKRVIRGLNPFEARVSNFHEAPVNTIVSMISQVGERYEGDIAFNPAASNVNNIGLIEAYETILRRGLKLSVDATPPVNFGPANKQLLLVASRIADFYMLLGNEAYADSLDPMIGFGTSSGQFGTLAPTIFAFQDQLGSLLEEELVLLRGRDDSQGAVELNPVYNRLLWNFTSGNGEFAYASAYNVSDENFDGFINEDDARSLYPQGHGDAWGHYLTAMQTYYKLLRHPFFSWLPTQEAVSVAGAPVQVDFMEERKFAQAAAAKARAGADIVDLTYRINYVEDPAGQWQGYKDTDPDRAWGLMEWGRRAGQGAYFDWVTGNSILPAEDSDPDAQGIQRVDRTTVEEFDEVGTLFVEIQQQVDDADRGLNPLGLAKGVVPFDIDPSFLRFDLGINGKTHFEQIFDRAKEALKNTITVFDHANDLNELLRRNQDSVDDMRANIVTSEAEFRNRLIEIFGYAYSDDIGPGGTYPAGYSGPDLYHYMYIDQSDLTGTPDQPAQVFTAEFTAPDREDPFFGFAFDPAVDRSSILDLPSDPLTVTYHSRGNNIDSFFLIKPPEWTGGRRSPGQLQDRLSDLLVALNDYEISIDQYDTLIKDIEKGVSGLTRQHGILARDIELKNIANGVNSGLDIAINVAKGVKIVLNRVKEIVSGAYKSAEECVPKSLVFGFTNGGDVLSAVRCGIKTVKHTTEQALDIGQDVADGVILAMEVAKTATSLATDIRLNVLSANADVKSRVSALESLVRQEHSLRLEAFGKREIVEQERGNYLAALSKGQRLLAELVAFRQKTAGDVQEYRFQDMAFRVFRNDALEKFRAQFDLAARYAYLAATAYDYETNLLGSHPQAGQDFLAEIVKQRSVGQVLNGEPVPGTQGLGDVMARLDQNFQVLKGQLGFNNPQFETTRFSLRDELFRLREGSDEEWRDTLEQFRVNNLFDVPAFKRFARPFAPETAGAQPGLVIPFSTTVNFGLNFFGFPLGPGDSAYDSSNFSTKIRSAGVWLESYDSLPLSATPRVYLIPVGADILRAPNANDFSIREWSVVDQVVPVPFPIGGADLTDPTWIPEFDSLSGFMGEVRRFSSMRAYSLEPGDENIDLDETTTDSRLIGRSVWNTRWLLIIPGGTTLFDPVEGLETLINGQEIPGDPDGERDGQGISDIDIFFTTYAFSGN